MKTWLIRPFDRVAGATSLTLGVGIVMLTALVGWLAAGIYTDGVLDLHIGPPGAFAAFIGMGLISWLALSLTLLAVGHFLTATRYRMVDLFGTQALARWPMLLATLVMAIPAYTSALNEVTQRVLQSPGALSLDIVWLMVLSAPPMIALVWMVWLMYHSYAIVFDLRGTRAILSFVAALIVAEILSKVLIVTTYMS